MTLHLLHLKQISFNAHKQTCYFKKGLHFYKIRLSYIDMLCLVNRVLCNPCQNYSDYASKKDFVRFNEFSRGRRGDVSNQWQVAIIKNVTMCLFPTFSSLLLSS